MKTSLASLALFLLGISTAHAQSYPNVYSPWAPWDPRLAYTWSVSLLDANGVEVNKNATTLRSLMSYNPITINFQPQTAAATVMKVKVGFTAIGTTGTVQDLNVAWSAVYILPQPYAIPAGATPTLVYTSLSFSPTLVASSSMPVVVPPPVVTPPPPPPPLPPPPTAGESPDLSSIPPLAQITNSIGEIWTKQGTHAFINGNDTGGSGFDTILYKAKVIYAHQSSGTWWQWRGSWASIPGVP